MKVKTSILVILILFGGILCYAQKGKIKPKTATFSIMEDVGTRENTELVPLLKDFAYVVEIDENSNISVTAQTSEDVKFLTNTADVKPLGDLFSGISATAGGKAAKPAFHPIVIIKPDSSLNYGEVLDVIKKIRNSTKMRIKVEVGPSYYAFTEQEDNRPANLKPNPLFLLARLDKASNVCLNQEPNGSLNDLMEIYKRLKQIFKDREANGVFRGGTNETETTVYINADPAASFSDVMKLIDMIKDSGSSAIGIDLGQPRPCPKAGSNWILN